MLTFDDCLGLCALTEEEVRAIALHEHLPEIVALELGDCLIRTPGGEFLVSHMVIDTIQDAERRGDRARAVLLKTTLRHFIEGHLAARKAVVDP